MQGEAMESPATAHSEFDLIIAKRDKKCIKQGSTSQY